MIEAAPVVIDLTFNFPRNKAKPFIVISKDKIQLSFRSGVDNFANMVPQISKEILSNFSYKYKRRATNTRRAGRSISRRIQQSSDDTRTGNITSSVMCTRAGTDVIDGISISNYTRCYVEDYMRREIG